jgi:hypothetical protein
MYVGGDGQGKGSEKERRNKDKNNTINSILGQILHSRISKRCESFRLSKFEFDPF